MSFSKEGILGGILETSWYLQVRVRADLSKMMLLGLSIGQKVYLRRQLMPQVTPLASALSETIANQVYPVSKIQKFNTSIKEK